MHDVIGQLEVSEFVKKLVHPLPIVCVVVVPSQIMLVVVGGLLAAPRVRQEI